MTEKITPSGQDYLEAILKLSQEGGEVRSVDIARELGFSRASVSRAMASLRNEDYILQEKYGTISLTQKGLTAAKSVGEKHKLLKGFLTKVLKVGEETAEADACRMEHAISMETAEKLYEYMKDK